jgi:hypothetical protein
MSSHGLSGVELTRRSLNARTSKQNGNCNARPVASTTAISGEERRAIVRHLIGILAMFRSTHVSAITAAWRANGGRPPLFLGPRGNLDTMLCRNVTIPVLRMWIAPRLPLGNSWFAHPVRHRPGVPRGREQVLQSYDQSSPFCRRPCGQQKLMAARLFGKGRPSK